MRDHDVSDLTPSQLHHAKRELQANLALARPGSPIRQPILARLSAIDTELARRPPGNTGEPPDFPRA